MASKKVTTTPRCNAVRPVTFRQIPQSLKNELTEVLNTKPKVSLADRKRMKDCPLSDPFCVCKALSAASIMQTDKIVKLVAAITGKNVEPIPAN